MAHGGISGPRHCVQDATVRFRAEEPSGPYWSLWKERWASTGPFGRTVLSISDALQFIAHEDIFWTMT
jgi:hypothetical protein